MSKMTQRNSAKSSMSLAELLANNLTTGLDQAAEKLSTQSDPVAWIEKNFFIPENRNDPVLRGRIKLMDYQKDAIREALSRDQFGNFKYSIIVWSDVKKSAKSTLAAAVVLYRAMHTEWGEFYIIANDLKQADSRVAHYIRRAIQLNPEFEKRTSMRGYRTTMTNGTFIEAIPIDPSGEAGSNADEIVYSELWGANEEQKQTMWAELTMSPTKHGQSFRWVESYAGFTDESKLLYSLYETGVKRGHMLWPDKLYEVTGGAPSPLELYVNEEARMLCLWNTQPRCPWQTPEYYASEAAVLLPNQFARMHRNQWVTSEETFVPAEWYNACFHGSADWPTIPKKQPMIIALDAATSSDNFGLWMGCRHPSNTEDIMTIFTQRWKPPHGGKIDFIGNEINPGPETVIRRLVKEYNVIEIAYDPYQLHSTAQRMKEEGLAWFRPFSQGADRAIADSQLYSLIRDRRFWHRGEPDLQEHIMNANAKLDENGSKMRIVKRTENMKIDLAVCASMGSYELLRLNLA